MMMVGMGHEAVDLWHEPPTKQHTFAFTLIAYCVCPIPLALDSLGSHDGPSTFRQDNMLANDPSLYLQMFPRDIPTANSAEGYVFREGDGPPPMQRT